MWRNMLSAISSPFPPVIVSNSGKQERVLFHTMEDMHNALGSVACVRNFATSTAFHCPIYQMACNFRDLDQRVQRSNTYDNNNPRVGEMVYVGVEDAWKIGGTVSAIVEDRFTVICLSGDGLERTVHVDRAAITRPFTEFANTERAAQTLQLHALALAEGTFVRVIRKVSIAGAEYFIAVKIATGMDEGVANNTNILIAGHTLFSGASGEVRVRGQLGVLPAQNIGVVVAYYLLPFIQWRAGANFSRDTRGATHAGRTRFGSISCHSRPSLVSIPWGHIINQ